MPDISKQNSGTRYSDVARNVSELLRFQGWTPTQAANHYGVSQPTMIRWINGQFMPRPSAFRQMALDSVNNPTLRNFFEQQAGAKVEQIVLEGAKYAPTPSKVHSDLLNFPGENLERVHIAITERLSSIYGQALSGQQPAIKLLARILEMLEDARRSGMD